MKLSDVLLIILPLLAFSEQIQLRGLVSNDVKITYLVLFSLKTNNSKNESPQSFFQAKTSERSSSKSRYQRDKIHESSQRRRQINCSQGNQIHERSQRRKSRLGKMFDVPRGIPISLLLSKILWFIHFLLLKNCRRRQKQQKHPKKQRRRHPKEEVKKEMRLKLKQPKQKKVITKKTWQKKGC